MNVYFSIKSDTVKSKCIIIYIEGSQIIISKKNILSVFYQVQAVYECIDTV